MNTTINVYPRLVEVPTFEQILTLSTAKLREFLTDYGIVFVGSKGWKVVPTVEVGLCYGQYDEPVPFDPRLPAVWDDSNGTYAWFAVAAFCGRNRAATFDGFTGRKRKVDESELGFWDEQISTNERAAPKRELIESCLKNRYYWQFEKAKHTGGVVGLAYGLVAGAVAQLTEGFIFSKDGAWEADRFPATAEELFSWYFRPELTAEAYFKQRVERDLKMITEGEETDWDEYEWNKR
jgi:hypothetical protein